MKTKTLNSAVLQTILLFGGILCSVSNVMAQETILTYQGRVTENATNFSGAGQFKFALVTSSNAAATATGAAVITSGFVTSVVVLSGGDGYVSAPTVTISGGGGSAPPRMPRSAGARSSALP